MPTSGLARVAPCSRRGSRSRRGPDRVIAPAHAAPLLTTRASSRSSLSPVTGLRSHHSLCASRSSASRLLCSRRCRCSRPPSASTEPDQARLPCPRGRRPTPRQIPPPPWRCGHAAVFPPWSCSRWPTHSPAIRRHVASVRVCRAHTATSGRLRWPTDRPPGRCGHRRARRAGATQRHVPRVRYPVCQPSGSWSAPPEVDWPGLVACLGRIPHADCVLSTP